MCYSRRSRAKNQGNTGKYLSKIFESLFEKHCGWLSAPV